MMKRKLQHNAYVCAVCLALATIDHYGDSLGDTEKSHLKQN